MMDIKFADLLYTHARLNIIEVESRVLSRYLRVTRDIKAIGERLASFDPNLRRFFQNSSLASAMLRLRPNDARILEEYRYYQDLAPELDRTILMAYEGLLKQEKIYDLAAIYGKTSFLALQNLSLMNQVQEEELARTEYRLMHQFKERYYADLLIDRSSSLSFVPARLLYAEPDYRVADLIWIDDTLFSEMVKVRKEVAKDAGYSHFTYLAKRRLGMLDTKTEESSRENIRDCIAKWLVPLAAYARTKYAGELEEESVQLFPHPASTLRLNETLPEPIHGEDTAELRTIWGRPEEATELNQVEKPITEVFFKLLEDVVGNKESERLRDLQDLGFIQRTVPDKQIALYLPETKQSFIAMESLRHTDQLADGISLISHALSLEATKDDTEFMLRFVSRDFMAAKALGLLALSLDRLAIVFNTEEEAYKVRDRILLSLLNRLIYSCLLEEFQDAIYEEKPSSYTEAWLSLLERWYPDLADSHEWLLSQEQSWRQIPALVMDAYSNAAELSAILFALQVWDKAQDKRSTVQAAYLELIQMKHSSHLNEALEAVGFDQVENIDTVKRLAYQLSRALDY